MVKISRDVHLVEDLGIKCSSAWKILGPEGAVCSADRLQLGNNISYPLAINPLERRQESLVHTSNQILAKLNSATNIPIRLREPAAAAAAEFTAGLARGVCYGVGDRGHNLA